MFRLAIYGKGGAGKSTVAANLSHLLSMDGSTVLHVGCDPKHDSTRLLRGGEAVRTFFSDTEADPIHRGENGIMCVECGGADPGRGCAGKGMELMFSRIAGVEADYRVCDVLGDVVCGGFAIPARPTECDAVLIVASGDFMSLYAANNILRGLANIGSGDRVMGLVLNRTGGGGEEVAVRRLAEAVGLPVVCDIPRSPLFAEAEAEGRTLCALHPESEEARILGDLAQLVRSHPGLHAPEPLSEESMGDLAAGRPIVRRGTACRRRVATFDGYDSERNISYVGDLAMPACTSHGAVDAAMRIRDAAAIVHGPRNCSYLMEFSFRRRILNTTYERDGHVQEPGIYGTRLDAEGAFGGSERPIIEAVSRAKADGYRTMFLIPTCASEIIGVDIGAAASAASEELGVDVIPVRADDVFLSSKFGGTFGLFDALICRMRPREAERGTANLIARWFYGQGKRDSMDVIEHLLGLLGLRVKHRLLDFCDMADIEDFCSAEYDIQMGWGMLNDRICERIVEVTGRRRAMRLDHISGLVGSVRWLRQMAEYAPELADRLPAAEASLREEFEAGISEWRPLTEGRSAVLYCVMIRDLEWQVETLLALGMEVKAIMFVKGNVVDHNVRVPDYGTIPVMEDAGMCDLMEIAGEADIVITNDSDRVNRAGLRWAPMGSRKPGVPGAIEWTRTVAECMRIPPTTWEAGL